MMNGDDEFKKFLLTQIRNDQLEKLVLLFSKFKGNDIYELVKELKGNKSVKEVLFRKCGFEIFLDVLCDALKVNTSVTIVDLLDNWLGNAGTQRIAEVFKVNQCVKKLFIGNNLIDSDGARAIGAMLSVNYTIEELDFSSNNIGSDGARHIAEALKVNQIIKVLLLSWNGIEKEGLQSIGEALKVNMSLKKLYVDHNIFDSEQDRSFLDLLQVNISLTECKVDKFQPEVSALCRRNISMCKRARDSVVHFLALRRMRLLTVFPKEIMVMIGQMLWRTKSDIKAWDKQYTPFVF